MEHDCPISPVTGELGLFMGVPDCSSIAMGYFFSIPLERTAWNGYTLYNLHYVHQIHLGGGIRMPNQNLKRITRQPDKGTALLHETLDDMVRSSSFKEDIQLMKEWKNVRLTPTEKSDADKNNKRCLEIVQEIEGLRKEHEKLLAKDPELEEYKFISEKYGLDYPAIWYALEHQKRDNDLVVNYLKAMTPICQLGLDREREMNPLNPGEDITFINRGRQLYLNAYPISISIHRLATKRGVIDYVNKDWKHIKEALGESGKLSRKKKLPQDVRDFLYANRDKTSKEQLAAYKDAFKGDGYISLTYKEISDIVKDESKRRSRDYSVSE
jgi:hypothetical protein